MDVKLFAEKKLAEMRAKRVAANVLAKRRKTHALEHEEYIARAAIRSASEFLDWVDNTDLSVPCPIELTSDGRLSQAPMLIKPVKIDRKNEVKAISRNLESGSTLTRQEPGEGSYVSLDPQEFWRLPEPDQRVWLARLCRAPGAKDRMEASKKAGNTAKQTINAELIRQNRLASKLGMEAEIATSRPAPLKKSVKTQGKRDQKAANTLGQGYGTRSFKSPRKWTREIGFEGRPPLMSKPVPKGASFFEKNALETIDD